MLQASTENILVRSNGDDQIRLRNLGLEASSVVGQSIELLRRQQPGSPVHLAEHLDILIDAAIECDSRKT